MSWPTVLFLTNFCRELFYLSRDGRPLAVEIAANPAFRAANPHPLGTATFEHPGWWNAAADGKRFLVTKSGPPTYTVVLNWQAGLK